MAASDSSSLPTQMVLSAFSGMGAACFCHPFDVIRVQMQVAGSEAGAKTTVASTTRAIMATNGFPGLYKGLTAAFLRQWMYGSGRMGIYSYLLQKYKIENPGKAMPLTQKLACGTLAGGVGAFIGTPSEVAIVRMAADSRLPEAQRRNYSNVFDCLGRVVREEGAANLYRGAGITVMRAMAMGSFQMGCYSETKEYLQQSGWDGKGVLTQTVSALVASLFANGASLPFDVIKSRIQNADPKNSPYSGVVDCARQSVQAEGPLVLWKGFTPAFVKLAPYTVLSLMFLENLTLWWTGKAAM